MRWRASGYALFLCVVLGAACGEKSPPVSDPSPPVQTKRVDPDLSMEKAREAWRAKRTTEVIATLWPVVRDHPKRVDAKLLLGRAYLKAARPKLALRQADAIVDLMPQLTDGRWLRAIALIRLARDRAAVKALIAVLETDPRHEEGLLELVRLQGLLKQYAAQDTTVQRLIAAKPDEMAYRLEYAKSKIRRNQLAAAETILKAAIAVNPYHAELHHVLAHLYYETGRLQAAMDEANLTLKIDPKYPKAHTLFQAAYYVAVASELTCQHGAGPWKKKRVDTLLARYARQGVKGTAFFYEVQKEMGHQPGVKRRVAAAVKRCLAKKAKPPSAP